MPGLSDTEMEVAGFKRVYDYTQYSHENHINVIPEEAFQRLTSDTFGTVADVLRNTYGPYGSTMMLTSQNGETTTTKDGYNIYNSLGFNHQYKRMVYMAIQNIIERVNRTVGDGTTSCILLAEKVFNKMLPLMDNPDNKRHLKEVLDNIELELQESLAIKRDMETGMILPMTRTALRNIIRVASNYDMKLVDMLMEALMPETDENDVVTSVRNVIVDSSSTYESVSNANYEVTPLPGDYRARINMDVDFALALEKPTNLKIVMYDHTFNASEWENFYNHAYDKEAEELVLLIARSFHVQFMDNEYTRYLKSTQLTKRPVRIYLAEIKGRYVQDELHDLAAILNVPLHDIHHLEVDYNNIPTFNVQVHNYNCLCINNATPPTDYINKLKIERDNETSYVRQTVINDRIVALSLDQKDTLVRVKAGTNLELKMITDKIDDCVSIVKSACNYGVVPNMLWYGDERISRIHQNASDHVSPLSKFTQDVCDAIQLSIEDLCRDIWKSKHGNTKEQQLHELMSEFYTVETPEYAFDIITDDLVPCTQLPTSAQYDLEVLVATLSIVKYLLTSRALVFDAFLMQPQGDQGHFVRDDNM